MEQFNALVNGTFIDCYQHFKNNKNGKVYMCEEGYILFRHVKNANKNVIYIDLIEMMDIHCNSNVFENLIRVMDADTYNMIILPGYGDYLDILNLENVKINNKHFINLDGDGVLVDETKIEDVENYREW